jgi:hypothetical protein
MKVVFYASEGKKFDGTLARCFGNGVRVNKDKYEVRAINGFSAVDPKTDVAVVAGVKGWSKECFDAHLAAGRHAVIIDKGYTRLRGGELGTLYWRLSIDAFQPHAYFRAVPRPTDRWEKLGVPTARRPAAPNGQVLFCGSSQKYCDWHGLGDATAYALQTLDELRRHTKREVVYRPKPSWGNAVPIAGYRYSGPEEKYVVELEKTAVVVTFGSNAAFEAVLAGVPALVAGDGIARPLARTALADVEKPLLPSPAEVHQLACDVAYCQWTLDEMDDGLAWRHVRQTIEMLTTKAHKRRTKGD